jgi:hypothetical protein
VVTTITPRPSIVDQCRSVAAFVDKILKVEKPADPSVQSPFSKRHRVRQRQNRRVLSLNVMLDLPTVGSSADQERANN